ncbi:baseplate J/gp47 family protein [Candidatus Haliotispira prima]|uniref:Baseplate J/gp47 family protein n=1 Tax=Candidatus Haliotispira prima TaxID=3034016 RepID=A0ABY8MHK0_9SPIO|nr:baseplate J/gp47 family protein [Candidatus Haliotispira prima]
MDFPTLETLEQRNLARIHAKFPEVEPGNPTGKGILEVMARMHANAMHLAYGMIDWHTRQLFPQTAEGRYLDNLLDWRPLPRLVTKRAKGTASVSGRVGSLIPKDSVIAANNGQRYRTLSEVKLVGANRIVTVQAVDGGTAANTEGEKGLWETAIAGMTKNVLVSATGGTDSETDAEYRARALETIQRRGTLYGKRGDYAVWAVDSGPEVVRAWEVPNFENKAVLGVLVTGRELADVSDGALENVRTALERNKLVGVLVEVLRAEVSTVDFRLSITPDTPDLRQAVKNAIQTYVRDRQKPQANIALSKLKEQLEKSVQGLNRVAILAPGSDIRTSQRKVPNFGAVQWV